MQCVHVCATVCATVCAWCNGPYPGLGLLHAQTGVHEQGAVDVGLEAGHGCHQVEVGVVLLDDLHTPT